jgi:hypothetical protein
MLKWKEWWDTPSWSFRNQIGALVDASGKIRVDFVGRYENLEHDFACVLDKIGLPSVKLKHFGKPNPNPPAPLTKLNPRPPGPYTQFYTADARDIVAHIASPTIEAFDYTFE